MQNSAMQCRKVLQVMADLHSIAAGVTSRYYNSDQAKLAAWLEVAEDYLQQTLTVCEDTGDVTRGISHEPVSSFSYLPNSPL